MRKNLFSLVAGLLLAGLGIGQADAADKVTFRAQWGVSIAADGSVTRLVLQTRLMPALVAPLEAQIRTWKFVPGKIDGKPADTETTLYVKMTATPDAAGHSRIQFDAAGTGAHYAKLLVPQYPESALTAHREGLALVRVKYDEQGRVTAAEAVDDGPKVSPILLKSALSAVRRSTFAPEIVGGAPIAGGAVVPFCFQVDPRARPAQCNWVSPSDGQEHGADEFAAVDPAAKLLTDIHERTL